MRAIETAQGRAMRHERRAEEFALRHGHGRGQAVQTIVGRELDDSGGVIRVSWLNRISLALHAALATHCAQVHIPLSYCNGTASASRTQQLELAMYLAMCVCEMMLELMCDSGV